MRHTISPEAHLILDAQADANNEIIEDFKDLERLVQDLRQAARIRDNDITEGLLTIMRKTGVILGNVSAMRHLRTAHAYGRA